MEITATTDKHGTATLKASILNSSTILNIPDADGLANDLAAVLNVGHSDTFRNAYTVLVKPDGIIVNAGNGSFNIPWQHINSVVAQLHGSGLQATLMI